MIVKCTDIYNENTQQIVDANSNGFVTKGFHYNVLAINVSQHELSYSVLADDSGAYASIVVRAKDFEVVSCALPKHWVVNTISKTYSNIAPKRWVDFSLWQESFWQDYFENSAAAVQCYIDEIKDIFLLDREYIQQMIDERPNAGYLERWHETMVPLFDEVLTQK